IDAVYPVPGLDHQRNGGLAPATEQDRRNRYALRVLVLRRQDRALGDRGAEARVRVGGQLPALWGPVASAPVGEVRRRVSHTLPPDVTVVGETYIGEDR